MSTAQLWRVDTKELVLQLFQRNFSKEAWPSLQLPSDESVVAHANPNVVNFYDPTDTTAGQSMENLLIAAACNLKS